MKKEITLKNPVKVRVVDTLPTVFGLCDLQLGDEVYLDKVQTFSGDLFYHILGKDQDGWYFRRRFVSC